MNLRMALWVGLALLVAVAGGWLWGATGRWSAERTLEATELRNALLEARSLLLDARLGVYGLNFGDTVRSLEDSKARLQQAADRYRDDGRDDDLKRVEEALTAIAEAQRMAGQLDQAANRRAADAAELVAALLAAAPAQ
jgi:hypothetical protein